MTYCKNCGAEMRDIDTFCHSCGSAVKNMSAEPNAKRAETVSNIGAKPLHTGSPSKIQFLNMLKKHFNWKGAAALLVVVLITTSASFMFFHKSDEEKILNLVSDLGESMSEGDFEGLLECFDPKSRAQMKSLMSIGSAIGGVDLKDLWSLGSMQMAGNSPDLKIIFTVYNIDFSDESNAEVEISANVDVQPAMHVKLKVVKIDGKWYFSDNSLFS